MRYDCFAYYLTSFGDHEMMKMMSYVAAHRVDYYEIWPLVQFRGHIHMMTMMMVKIDQCSWFLFYFFLFITLRLYIIGKFCCFFPPKIYIYIYVWSNTHSLILLAIWEINTEQRKIPTSIVIIWIFFFQNIFKFCSEWICIFFSRLNINIYCINTASRLRLLLYKWALISFLN